MYTFTKYHPDKHGGYAVRYPNGELVAVLMYRKGAEEAARFLNAELYESKDGFIVVCVTETVSVSDDEESPETAEEKIKRILRRYFEFDDSGEANPEFDDCFTAQDAIDEIHAIVGNI